MTIIRMLEIASKSPSPAHGFFNLLLRASAIALFIGRGKRKTLAWVIMLWAEGREVLCLNVIWAEGKENFSAFYYFYY